MADNKIMTNNDNKVTNKTKALYFAEGTITVKAKGYWYSNGGIKGSFGYYPHLKDCEGFPVFPDTQIKGNLQMAVKWYSSLSQQKNLNIDKLFGKEGDSDSSLLKITDLILTEKSKDKWRDNGGSSRFQIKTRIKINPEKKIVAEHFLVDLESAFLDDLTLESKFYLGYFTDKTEFDNAVDCIQNAVDLLPGFGAFRSRGFGRGDVSIKIDKSNSVVFPVSSSKSDINALNLDVSSLKQTNHIQFDYYIKSLVNIRNKRPGSGTLQNVETMNYISESQLRSWFIKTWFNLFGSFPDYNDVKRIKMQPLYYADLSRTLLFCPPPVTTLIDENEIVADKWDKKPKEEQELENYIQSKTKPLSEECFVTKNGSIEAVKIIKEQRMRNKLDDNFITGTDSLFVQELIPKGICFGTTIQIEPIDASANNGNPVNDDFLNKAIFIFKNINPTIKGAIFEPTVIGIDKKAHKTNSPENPDSSNTASEADKDKKPLLVVQPIPYSTQLIKSYNSIRLSSTRNYNTVLKRHKRNRIVIEPSSVIVSNISSNTTFNNTLDSYKSYCIEWNGFGKDNIPYSEIPKNDETANDDIADKNTNDKPKSQIELWYEREKKYGLNEIIKNISNYIISNSQAGFLRELLNEQVAVDHISKTLKHRIEKHGSKGGKQPLKEIMEAVRDELENNGIASMRMLISHFLETLGVAKWDAKKKSSKENRETKKDTKEVKHGTK